MMMFHIFSAYDFIKRHISFANEATRYENGRQVLYNPNNRYDFVSLKVLA